MPGVWGQRNIKSPWGELNPCLPITGRMLNPLNQQGLQRAEPFLLGSHI